MLTVPASDSALPFNSMISRQNPTMMKPHIWVALRQRRQHLVQCKGNEVTSNLAVLVALTPMHFDYDFDEESH